jgi:uncharacterized protein YbcI
MSLTRRGGPHDSPQQTADASIRAGLESAMVSLFKQCYGKGPAAAKAMTRDEYVIVVLEEGLTRNEETLIEHGLEDEVRRFRLAFQATVRDHAAEAVRRVTGRHVVAYHSQVTFHPFRSFEIFVLEAEPATR